MNPLQEYPQVRQWAYRALWIIGLLLGAIQVYMQTTGQDSPDWLLGAVAVLGYVSIVTNYTADRNVSPTTVAETPPEDRGFVEDDGKDVDDELARPNAPLPGAFRDEEGDVPVNSLLIMAACVIVIIAGVIFIVQAL